MMKMSLKSAVLALPMLLFSAGVFAQAHDVKGKVLDEESQPIAGANVMIKGTTSGTITAGNGEFQLKANDGDVLQISFIGYTTEEITVSGAGPYNVSLLPDLVGLDEVVVVGYGTMKKSDLTGAVASVRSDDLKARSTTDAAAALQGKVTGVQILNNSGAPGSQAQIRVRGYSSNSGNIGPLLIVDGLKVDNIQYLDPSMIESMEVLKDAASAAIYGAQAGNGVVLITTKSGKGGQSSIIYEGKFTRQSLAKKAELFEGKEYVDYQLATGKITQDDLNNAGWDGSTYNWFDAVFDASWSQQHSITMQGGNERGHYMAAGNYVNNDGIVVGKQDVYERLTLQVNADYNIKKWLSVSTNNSIEKWDRKSVSQSSYGSMLNSVMSLDPLTPAYYSNIEDCAPAMIQHYNLGDPIPTDPSHNNDFYATSKFLEESTGNPLFQRDKTDASSGGYSIRGTSSLDFKPFKFLTLTSRFGYRLASSTSHSFTAPYWITAMANSVEYNISANVNNNWYYQWENFMNFNKTFDVHSVSAMVGMSYDESHSDNVSGSSSGTDILKGYADNFRYLSFLKDDATKTISNDPGKSASMSYFGRLMYTYNDKYSLQANFRADAFDSSKLAKESRWGKFPSFSAGWTASNEDFISNNISTDILSYLKFRGSWGRNGNINILNNYQYDATISLNDQWYQYDGENPDNLTYGSGPTKLANPDLKWETSEQVDFGIDARLLNNRLSFTFDWFKKTTKDLLLQIAPTPEIGVKQTYTNAGEVLNSGLEFELGWKDQIGDLHYSVNANFSTLHNEVKKLHASVDHLDGGVVSGLNYQVSTRFEAGQPIWYFYGYKYAGADAETGKPTYYDQNGEITNDPTDNDKHYLGKAIPDATYGLTMNLEYKGIDFSLYGTGTIGNDIFCLLYSADRPRTNCLKMYYEDSWTEDNKGAKYANVKEVAGDWKYWSSDVSLFKGSYFKIKQIQLGYTIPKQYTEKVFVDNCRVFVSLDDFITLAKYPGCDPETATTGSQSQMGYDAGTYPTTKKVVFGVSLTF